MTAICGIVQLDGYPVSKLSLDKLMNFLKKYGGDSSSTWLDRHVALGRTLQRLTPEDLFDKQPLTHAGGSLISCFSGRLDNRAELADLLAIPKQQLKTIPDSQLAAFAFEKWGEDTPKQLLGDFAFVVWNQQEQRLFLARDPMGWRPLYWYKDDAFFAFSSAAPALHTLDSVLAECDEQTLLRYLALLPASGENTCYKNIYRLEPGCTLVLSGRQLNRRRYFEFDPEARLTFNRDGDYVEAFREILEKATSARLRSFGNVGAQLSSGFDSATVCTIAAEQLHRENKNLHAFTAIPRKNFHSPVLKGRHGDESSGATALAATHTNIMHHLVESHSELINVLNENYQNIATPQFNPWHDVWIHDIRLTAKKKKCSVILTGDMGNFTISYDGKYALADSLRQGNFIKWGHTAISLIRENQWTIKKIIGMSFFPFLPPTLWAFFNKNRQGKNFGLENYSSINRTILRETDFVNIASKIGFDMAYRPKKNSRQARANALQRFDAGDRYLNSIAAAGLEERDVTADIRLINFCLAIPEEQFLKNGDSRWLLQRSYGNRLPNEIRYSKTKGLQAADWHEKLSGELDQIKKELEDIKNDSLSRLILDTEKFDKTIANWASCKTNDMNDIRRFQLLLFRGLSVGNFIKNTNREN